MIKHYQPASQLILAAVDELQLDPALTPCHSDRDDYTCRTNCTLQQDFIASRIVRSELCCYATCVL